MAIDNSTLEQLTERVRGAFRVFLPDSDSWLYPNNLWITATVIGGLFWEALSTVRNMPNLYMPDVAEGVYLERWAGVQGVYRTLADYASGNVIFFGSNGAFVPAGTVVTANNGNAYETLADVTIDASLAASAVVRAKQVGSQYNLIVNTPMSLGNAIAGVDSVTVGNSALTGGVDDETDDELRERMLLTIRSTSRYGTMCDFRDWALEVEGVEKSWVRMVGGTIQVIVRLDGASVQQVLDHMTDECRKPICAIIDVLEVVSEQLSVNLQCDQALDDQTKEQIRLLLQDYLDDNSYPGKSYDKYELEKVLCSIGYDVTVIDQLYTPSSDDHVFDSVAVVV